MNLDRLLNPLKRAIRQLLIRGVVTLTKDSGEIQELQLTTFEDDVINKVERFSEFGFSSHLPKNSEVVVASIGGSREHSIVVATNHRKSRLKGLPEGATTIYSQNGDKIVINNDGTIEVVANTKVTVTAPDAEFSGNVKIKGNLVVDGTSTLTGDVTAGANLAVAGQSTLTGPVNAAATVTAGGPVSAPAISSPAIAGASISVAGTELAAYAAHTHTDSEGGTTGPPIV